MADESSLAHLRSAEVNQTFSLGSLASLRKVATVSRSWESVIASIFEFEIVLPRDVPTRCIAANAVVSDYGSTIKYAIVFTVNVADARIIQAMLVAVRIQG